jgi:SMC interacting uncharacterized protein involved in chromosome segregation
MESIITIILSVITAIGGFEAIKYFFNRKSEKKKSEAEANSAMANVLKEMTESYQVFIEDTKEKIEDDQKYIRILKDEREELRQRIDQTDEKVRELQRDVARNERMMEGLRPFMCGVLGCKRRKPVTISEEGDVEPEKNGPEIIDPIENSVL